MLTEEDYDSQRDSLEKKLAKLEKLTLENLYVESVTDVERAPAEGDNATMIMIALALEGVTRMRIASLELRRIGDCLIVLEKTLRHAAVENEKAIADLEQAVWEAGGQF